MYTLNQIIDNHILLLSETTARAFESDRRILEFFCRSINKEIQDLTPIDVSQWAAWRLSRIGQRCRKDPKPQTVAYVTVLQWAFRWRAVWNKAIAYGVLKTNPWMEVVAALKRKARKGTKRPTEALTDQEVANLLNFFNETTKNGLRDKVFFLFLYGGGMRISEAANVKIQHLNRVKMVDAENNIITKFSIFLPETKNGTSEEQDLPVWCNPSIEKLLTMRRLEGAEDSDPLFIQYRGYIERAVNVQYSTSRWHDRWKQVRDELGINPNATSHSGRATAATKLLKSGAEKKAVQQFLRHSTANQVDTYDKRTFKHDRHASNVLVYTGLKKPENDGDPKNNLLNFPKK